MSSVYLTSDLHLGHQKLADLRFGSSTRYHDSRILEMFDVLTKNDAVWVLGDLSKGSSTDEEYALDQLRRRDIPARMHLILGNHDLGHPQFRGSHKRLSAYLKVFDSVQLHSRLGKHALVSHMPYEGDHKDEDRLTQWRLRDEGTTLYHGHTHSVEPSSLTAKGTLQVNVAPEATNYKLFKVV